LNALKAAWRFRRWSKACERKA